MNQRVAHINLDTANTLVVPTPKRLCLRIDLPKGITEPVKYLLVVDGESYKGTLNHQGEMNVELPPGSSTAEFNIWPFGEKADPFTWQLKLGQLPDIDSLQGVQARLNNLGFNAGPEDGLMGKLTRAALKRFQMANKLNIDGTPNEQTKTALIKAYGN